MTYNKIKEGIGWPCRIVFVFYAILRLLLFLKRTQVKKLVQKCNHCGRAVHHGSGLFINRVPDFNDVATRIVNNLKYPDGDFVCLECDEKISDDFKVIARHG